MIALRAFAFALVAAVMVSASPAGTRTAAAPGGDGMYTDVKIEGDIVTIVVPLLVAYPDGATVDAAGVAAVEAGVAAAAAYWNSGFARLASCLELRLQVDVAFSPESMSASSEFDRYHLVLPNSHWSSGQFPDGRGLPTVVYTGVRAADLAGHVDTTYPFDQFTKAYFPGWVFLDRWALAHELGHFFGLGEDYNEDGIIPGREGSLMGGTEGADYVDQAILDDVMKLIEDAGYDLPSCITGKFVTDIEQRSISEHQDTYVEYRLTVTFEMRPKEDGTLEGEGEAVFHAYTHDVTKGENGCEGFMGPVDDRWPVTLKGRFTDDVLSFEVEPTSKTVTYTVTGSCGSDSFPHEVAHFLGWADIRFTEGIYEYSVNTPLTAPDSGHSLVELKMKRSPAN